MTETQVGYLYKAASSLQNTRDNKSLTLLRSYYLMRCKDLTKGYGLPEKHFSSKARCSKCCMEWKRDTETKIKALKLSKTQRRRIRCQKFDKSNKEVVAKKKELLNSNQIEQICSFCKQSTITTALKPEKEYAIDIDKGSTNDSYSAKSLAKQKHPKEDSVQVASNLKKIDSKKGLKQGKSNKKKEVNVYSNTTEIFSLYNKNNTLVSTKKEEHKVIKNNKKKKDKFAGLCQKAVLATAKLKEEKGKQNKLNLFLKPSS